jgi:hypothetical protein
LNRIERAAAPQAERAGSITAAQQRVLDAVRAREGGRPGEVRGAAL